MKYAILIIETGELLLRDCRGDLLSKEQGGYKSLVTATWSTRARAHSIFYRHENINPYFHNLFKSYYTLKDIIKINGRDVPLDREHKCLFEVIELNE